MTDQPKWTRRWLCVPAGDLRPSPLLTLKVVLQLGVHAVEYQIQTPLYHDNAAEMLPIMVPALAEKARQKEGMMLQQLYSQMH